MHSFGQEFLVLEVVCCQVSGQLLRSIPIDYNSNSGKLSLVLLHFPLTFLILTPWLLVQVNSQMQALLPMILQGVELVCDTRITPSPYPVITATAVLLNQVLNLSLLLSGLLPLT